MSLRQHLNNILPEFLPPSPSEAIKGTELINQIKLKLKGNYSDASLRYHFSIMSCDPTSPIAKVEKGQGYYRRLPEVINLVKARELLSQSSLDDLTEDRRTAINLAEARLKKFQAIVIRHSEFHQRFSFPFSLMLDKNPWAIPDLALVDWGRCEPSPHGTHLEINKDLYALRRSVGLSPYQITSVALRLRPSLEHYRENLFQALSVGSWTQGSELYYALPIEDEALADNMRALCSRFGIGVVTFGLSYEKLDELQPAEYLLKALPREIEALMDDITIQRLSPVKRESHLDWTALETLRRENEEISNLFIWLSRSIGTGKISPLDKLPK